MRRDGGRSTGCIWRLVLTSVTLPDGRTVRYGYNSQRQVTSVVSPDGLRAAGHMTVRAGWRKRSRATVTLRAGFMTPDSLPGAVPATNRGDAQNNAKPVRVSLLAFTDCSGYTTRYEYDRCGQMTAVHRRKASAYSSYNPRGRGWSVGEGCAGAVKPVMSTPPQAT